MKRFDEIRGLLMSLEGDFEKFFEKEDKATARRLDEGLQRVSKMAQEIRTDIQTRIKA
ncbi:hypothetical protein [Pelagibius sp. Alg239-R121]|uniref:hypothetical protein n=1 Tax=Pelagibius sp. Alg239-R121 TaxID=2993448 RepID=UPI0024A77E4A|nr:hypothetical protein [Pelagibius sp. Alg239-R121]